MSPAEPLRFVWHRLQWDRTAFAALTVGPTTWMIHRGWCPNCGRPVGVATDGASPVARPRFVFDGLAGPDDSGRMAWNLHQCHREPIANGHDDDEHRVN